MLMWMLVTLLYFATCQPCLFPITKITNILFSLFHESGGTQPKCQQFHDVGHRHKVYENGALPINTVGCVVSQILQIQDGGLSIIKQDITLFIVMEISKLSKIPQVYTSD